MLSAEREILNFAKKEAHGGENTRSPRVRIHYSVRRARPKKWTLLAAVPGFSFDGKKNEKGVRNLDLTRLIK